MTRALPAAAAATLAACQGADVAGGAAPGAVLFRLTLDDAVDVRAVAAVEAVIDVAGGFPAHPVRMEEGGPALRGADADGDGEDELVIAWPAAGGRELSVQVRFGNDEAIDMELAGVAWDASRRAVARGETSFTVPAGGGIEVAVTLECGAAGCAAVRADAAVGEGEGEAESEAEGAPDAGPHDAGADAPARDASADAPADAAAPDAPDARPDAAAPDAGEGEAESEAEGEGEIHLQGEVVPLAGVSRHGPTGLVLRGGMGAWTAGAEMRWRDLRLRGTVLIVR